MKEKNKNYVIGVDGGGTKTMAALAGLNGKILARAKTGPSNPRNLGLKTAIDNAALAIKKVLGKKKKISATFLGLPAMEEEFKFKKNTVKKELLKHKEISPIFKGKTTIGSDQVIAFKSVTNKKDGVLLIVGTGCVAHGWRKGKESHASGWGYLADEGSGFWTGQKGFQAVLKELDDRGEKTLMTRLIFKKLRLKNKEDFLRKVYSKDFIRQVSLLSGIINKAAEKRDKVAKNIISEAGKELALTVKIVIKKLNFQKEKFPLVLIGRMFRSKIVLNALRKEVKKFAPKVKFIRPRVEPVIGAVKLAIEAIKTA